MKAVDSKLIYVGSSKNLQTRKNIHMSQISKNDIRRGTKALAEAYHHGDYVTFEVIELCDNYLEREQYWINFYRSQDTFLVVNMFDAVREGSRVPDSFRDTMSSVLKERWKDPVYRREALAKLKPTQLTAERLNKPVHVFTRRGEFVATHISAKECARALELREEYVNAAARGRYANRHCLKQWILVYNEVLDKLDELLETHQELRAISSEVWRATKSSITVQRLTSEPASNNLDTSVQHLQFVGDDIV